MKIGNNHWMYDTFKIESASSYFDDDLLNFMRRRITEAGKVTWYDILTYKGFGGLPRYYEQIAWTEARFERVDLKLGGGKIVTLPYPDMVG